MNHSAAQAQLDRLARNLYDGSAEKQAVLAAARALAFAHSLACHNGAVSIPAQTMLQKVRIETEPETVLQPTLEDIRRPPAAPTVAETEPA